MNPSDKCRVDDCDRRAAASVAGESLPGSLRLCLTHTEDYRMNGAGWTVVWETRSMEPTSVKAAAAAPVGRGGADEPGRAELHVSLPRGIRSRLQAWQGRRARS